MDPEAGRVARLVEATMKAMILIYGDEHMWAKFAPAELEREMGAYAVYTEALIAAGVFVEGSELHPTTTAKSVRVGGTGQTVTDGPYAETKEQLGGYYILNVPSMEEAIAWAAKCPGARHGGVEVRPLVERG